MTLTLVTLETVRGEPSELEAPTLAPHCETCGTVAAPDGACLELGACTRADKLATRGAGRISAKYAPAPASWNSRGAVD